MIRPAPYVPRPREHMGRVRIEAMPVSRPWRRWLANAGGAAIFAFIVFAILFAGGIFAAVAP
jgi:hypothetical protein